MSFCVFICLWLCWIFTAAWASHHSGSSCGRARALGSVAAAPGSRAPAQYLWHMGLVVPWPLGSSQTRDRTQGLCTARPILLPLSHQGSFLGFLQKRRFTHLKPIPHELGQHMLISLKKTLKLGKIEGTRRGGSQGMRWLDGISGQEFEQTPGDGEGQWSLACCSPWGRREADITQRLS